MNAVGGSAGESTGAFGYIAFGVFRPLVIDKSKKRTIIHKSKKALFAPQWPMGEET